MGREIRRVPKGWKHPKDERGHYKPLYDADYDTRITAWIKGREEWNAGTHLEKPGREDMTYEDWEGSAPDPEYFRPAWKPEDMTCYQVYETVSEGTPTSPVFENLTDLIEWLVGQGYSRKAAEEFAKDGWVPSMAIVGGKLYVGIESAALPREGG